MEWNKGGGLSQKNGCFSLAFFTVDHTLHLPPQDSAYVHGATQLWIEPSETTRQDRRFFHSIFLRDCDPANAEVTDGVPSQPRLVG